MKHPFKITSILIILFVLSQIIGLFAINQSINVINLFGYDNVLVSQNGFIVNTYGFSESNFSPFSLLIPLILVITTFLIIIPKFKLFKLWTSLLFLATTFAITMIISVFIPTIWAFLIALILILLRYFKKNIFTHHLSEILIYPGIAVLIVPLLTLKFVFILMIIVSLFDMFMVKISKHMIKASKFMIKSKEFPGFFIDYSNKEVKK